MKFRKYFKTALSAMLAAAMVVTAVPSDTIYAAQTAQTIKETEQTSVITEGTPTAQDAEEVKATETSKEETAAATLTEDAGTAEPEGTGTQPTETAEPETTPETPGSEAQNPENPDTENAEPETPDAEAAEPESTPETPGSEAQNPETLESETQNPETPDAEAAEPESEDEEAPVQEAAIDVSTGYWGPTINYDSTSDTAGAVTVYYYAQNWSETVTSVKVKGSWDASWGDLIALSPVDDEEGMFSYTFPLDKMTRDKSYEYGFTPNADSAWDKDDCNPHVSGSNSTILRNPVKDASGNVTLYYYPSHGDYPKSVKVKYRTAGSSDAYTEKDMSLDATWTKIYSANLAGLADGTYEYVFDVDGTTVTDTNNAVTGQFEVATYPEENPDMVSPEIDGKKVKFHYYGPTKSDVKVAGNMTGWGDNPVDMTYDESTAYWNLEMELGAGKYEYKFIVDGNYILDSLNQKQENGNSAFVITGLENKSVEAKKGADTVLPTSLLKFDAEGNSADAAVTYTLSAETAAKEWADKITLTENAGTTTLKVASDIPAEVTEFTLTAADADGNTAVIIVSVVDVKYTYTIYYYDESHTLGTTALWIWTTGVDGKAYPFTETEVLADGNTWLKATVDLSYTDLQIIPSDCPTWSWQDSERKFSNTEKKENVTLYIAYDDSTNIYTELPELKKAEERFLVVEYTVPEGETIDGYQLYTWNSGYGSEVWVPFEAVEGSTTTGVAKVKVKQGLSSLSYCISKTVGDNKWGAQDGKDYLCRMPLDQSVVKCKMEKGKGITYIYPYNTGYEIAPLENKIHFYYRNDEAFAAGSTGGMDSVKVEINGKAYDMTFDTEKQRYIYDLENLESGTYKYRYLIKETADAEAEYVLDKFNTETVKENDVEYSVCEYEKFEVTASAKFANATMDYNDNNVLSISFEGAEGVDLSGMEVSATADLTALGGGVTEIDSKLLALTVAVKEGTPTGEKSIPVTIYDQYNNEYKTTATVTVTERNKNGDFDWDEAVIYFTVTDRFFDGNKSNNGSGYNTGATGSSSYHGGDFAGLTKKLDYLQELGVNTIWITPIVENKMSAGLTTDVQDVLSWGYHGYWASNFEKLDSHLGTEKEFKALLDAAHKRGMKIMVDVVLNHSGYGQEDYFNNILKDENGNSIPMIRTSEQMVSGSDQMTSLSGLPDFLTENAEVRELLVEWQSKWISKYDIDYYRIDTVKHVDDTTWSAFKNALTKINPDFKMIGEWAGAGYATDTGMLGTGRMDSLLDFDFNDRALNFVTGDLTGTESFLAARNAAIDNTATLGAFLGSHDEDGFIYRLIHEKNVAAEDAEALAKVAASLQVTTKGQVVIYYGEEIGMTGANNYPYQTNRYDFDWSLVNDNNEMLQHYKKLLSIRKQYSEVFAKGTRTALLTDNAQKLDVFARSYGGKTVYTGLNLNDTAAEYTFTGLKADSYVMDVYGNNLYRTDADGNVTVTIPAAADGGTAVFVEQAEGDDTDPFHVTCIDEKTYTGKAITLSGDELEVYYGTTRLTEGTDYKVTYKNNKAVGTATVTVTGKGNYSGKDTVTFAIAPKNLGDEDIIVEYTKEYIENGKNQNPLTKITYNGIKLKGTDIKVEYFAVDEEGNKAEKAGKVNKAGAYKMVVTGKYDATKNKGSFTGSVEKDIIVYAKSGHSYLKDMVITIGGKSSYKTEYTGTEIEPAVKVTPKGRNQKAVSADCYTVSYENNVNIGTATVTITGVPEKGIVGTVTKTFKITGTDIKKVAQIDTKNWKSKVVYDAVTGTAVQPVDEEGKNLVTLKAKSGSKATFTEGVDYEVSYQKNDKPGTAKMVFKGIGKYTGTITKTFTVTKITLAEKDSKLQVTADTESVYAKKGSKIGITLTYNGVKLTEGKDYKVTYSNNKAVTTSKTKENKKPVATITGIGAFSGKISKKFAITAADFETNVTITAADAAYQNKKGKYKVVPVLTDADGTKLANNKDFTCKYYLVEGTEETLLSKEDVVDAGATVKVVATAKAANYTGSISTTYEIKVQDISKASVTVKAQIYTGKEITITDKDFTKIKVGDTKLKLGTHYEIVEDSYENNINKGTASVTIKGIGNYGGTKKVTFKITSRPMAWWWNLLH